MNYDQSLERIREELRVIPLVDTHEHIQPQSEVINRGVDLFDLIDNFLVSDLISAGMSVQDEEYKQLDSSKKWERIRPYLPHLRTTTYYRFYLAAFRTLFDFKEDEINDKNWSELSEKITETNKRDDWYKTVLRDKSNLAIAFLDRRLVDEWDVTSQFLVPLGNEEINREFFLPVLHATPFLYKCSRRAIENSILPGDRKKMWGLRIDLLNRIFREWGVSPENLEDYLDMIDHAFKRTMVAGGVSVKLICAYERSLNIEAVTREEAENVFNMSEDEISPLEAKKFEDYIARIIVEKAIEYNFPVQIHTGMLAGNGNLLNNANPLHLNNLFLEYPEAYFDIFHAGIPFTDELGILAKTFPNVYINLCWLPQLSDTFTKQALSKLIDLVPGNKFLWGGDCFYVELFFGAMIFSKRVVAEVLAKKVADNYFGLPTAIQMCRNIFSENAIRLYRLDIDAKNEPVGRST